MTLFAAPTCCLLAALLTGLCAGGCTPKEFHIGGESTAGAESSRLRTEAAQLKKETAALWLRLQASETENALLRRRADGRAAPAGVVPPAAVSMELDRISGPVNTDPEASINAEQKGLFDTLRLYVMPYDQEHRLIPVAGTAKVRLLEFPKPGESPRMLAEKVWDAKVFAATWRDNLTGIHFRLEMPLPPNMPAKWTVQVEVEDQVTGQVLRAEQVFPR